MKYLASSLSLLLLLLANPLHAQEWPNRPISLIVSYPPGGTADLRARTIAGPLGKMLGTSVVVENKPGASGQIAASFVAKANADGYTLMLDASSYAVNPSLFPKLPYDPNRDFKTLGILAQYPNVLLVHPGFPAKSVKEMVALAKSKPNGIAYASSGNGSAPHLAAALFSQIADIKMTHIPFRGGSLAIQSVIAGDTQLTFGTPPSVLPMIQAGRLKGLAISAKERSPLAPGLPGMREAGLPDYAIEFWYGLFVPAGTPPAIVQKLYEATQEALKQPNVKASLAREGTDVSLSTSPAQFAKFLSEDEKFWVKLVKSADVTVD
jgi:tripartite-type tricarboxylate transporter receptor subunit TctC